MAKKSKKQPNGFLDIVRLSEDIYMKRQSEGVTIRELSELTELSIATIQRYEKCIFNKGIELNSLIHVCNWLDKPVQHYLTF